MKSNKKIIVYALIGLAIIILITTAIITNEKNKKQEEDKKSAVVSVDRINLKADENQVDNSQKAATTVEIQFGNHAVPVGTTVMMYAIVTPDNTEQALNWTSQNSEVASITKDGLLTVNKTGTAVITASIGTSTDSVIIEGISDVSAKSEKNLPVYTASDNSIPGNDNSSDANAGSGNSGRASNSSSGSNGLNNENSSNKNLDSGNDTQVNDGINENNAAGNGNSDNGGTGEGNKLLTQEQAQEIIQQQNPSNSAAGSGESSQEVAQGLPTTGFSQRYSNVYEYVEDNIYYGEIITQPDVTIIYIKKRNENFDNRVISVIADLLPEEHMQVWNNYLSASTDKTFTSEGRKVRIVVAQNGGHSQIVIYN